MAKSSDLDFRWRDWTAPRHWPTWLGIGALWLITRLPVDAVLAIGRFLGPVFLRVIPGRAEVLRRNIALALPDADQEDIARRSIRHTGMGAMETAWVFFRNTDVLDDRVVVHGSEHLEQALATKRGVLFLQPHFSVLDLNCPFVAGRWPTNCVYDSPKNPLFALLLARARSRFVVRAIPNEDVRDMVRRLRRGELIWFSPDHAVSAKRGGVETRYFGQSVLSSSGTARLIAMTGSLIVPLTWQRSDDGKQYTMYIDPAVELDTSDIVEATQTVNDMLEAQVRRFPEQYIWVHKRFKPPGPHVSNPYAKL